VSVFVWVCVWGVVLMVEVGVHEDVFIAFL
jgi:hypothetical protein